MAKRIWGTIPALVVLVCAIYFHGLYVKIFVGLLTLLCIHEMMNVISKGSAQPMKPIGYAFAVLLVPAFEYIRGFSGVLLLTAAAIMVIFIVLILKNRTLEDGLITVLPMLYPGVFLAFLIALAYVPMKGISQFLIIIAFASSAATDTFAYFTGMAIGKHKLAPGISPKKTVEGAIGGMVFGTVVVAAIGIFAQGLFSIYIAPFWYIILGLVLSVLTQFGDLSASMIKRKFGAKDYGKIMAGHGGAMDRLDSVLFISPVVFAFYLIVTL